MPHRVDVHIGILGTAHTEQERVSVVVFDCDDHSPVRRSRQQAGPLLCGGVDAQFVDAMDA
jgi:hypothetical protein